MKRKNLVIKQGSPTDVLAVRRLPQIDSVKKALQPLKLSQSVEKVSGISVSWFAARGSPKIGSPRDSGFSHDLKGIKSSSRSQRIDFEPNSCLKAGALAIANTNNAEAMHHQMFRKRKLIVACAWKTSSLRKCIGAFE
ncbi:hypothetical protein [Rhizobium tubonense]|uniref:hypothetical protein n=1 Tax=Rhizobium tubonense TaxID=484088 RepID=UPI0011B740DB|nr:hypothetical protein [Rhizobium tubonense]